VKKTESRRIIPLVLALAFSLVLAVNIAHAATATVASAWTTDADGNPKVLFDFAETIYIHWKADGTVNIKVEFEDGTTDGSWPDQPSEGVIEYDPSKGAGFYSIYCTGANAMLVAYGRMLVIPALPFGTLMATVTSFGALGIIKLKKARYRKI